MEWLLSADASERSSCKLQTPSSSCVRYLFMCLSLRVAFLLCSSCIPSLVAHADTSGSLWARLGPDGKLTYKADERGNTIPDFSRAGYGGGGVKIPELPVVVTLSPETKGDDGARIQAALDTIAQRPADARGWRGAVLLKRGVYRVEGSLVLQAGGVVLRGEGS